MMCEVLNGTRFTYPNSVPVLCIGTGWPEKARERQDARTGPLKARTNRIKLISCTSSHVDQPVVPRSVCTNLIRQLEDHCITFPVGPGGIDGSGRFSAKTVSSVNAPQWRVARSLAHVGHRLLRAPVASHRSHACSRGWCCRPPDLRTRGGASLVRERTSSDLAQAVRGADRRAGRPKRTARHAQADRCRACGGAMTRPGTRAGPLYVVPPPDPGERWMPELLSGGDRDHRRPCAQGWRPPSRSRASCSLAAGPRSRTAELTPSPS